MNLFDIIQFLWPIAAFITPFVLAGGFAWLQTKFPSKADLEKLQADREQDSAQIRADAAKDIAELTLRAQRASEQGAAFKQRIKALELDGDRSPTKIQLSKDIGKVAERVGHVESGIEHIRSQLDTQNSYLHTLIERHLG